MPKILPGYKNFRLTELEPFSKIELIALDLDGTLLSSGDSEIPNKVLELAKSLKKSHKVMVIIATGRTLNGAKLFFDNLPTSKITPAILYNGGLIVNPDYEILYKKTIEHDAFFTIIDICSKYEVQVYAYVGKSGDLDMGPIEEFVFGWSNLSKPMTEYNGLEVCWLDWNNICGVIDPSTIVIHVNKNVDTMEDICRKLKKIGNIVFTRGQDIYIEVSPIDCNKGYALKYICEKILNLDRKQVLAMGDNDNDATMLNWAGIGVAVKSASKLALENSDYVAKGVIDGAIEVLNLVKQARRFFK
jgi:Cof subfamily protein (haloacid dehalogenase superfamily)